MKVMVIFGTRPEAIKMCPLVNELKHRNRLETIVCVTGQHKEMLSSVLDVFKIIPDYNLHVMKNWLDAGRLHQIEWHNHSCFHNHICSLAALHSLIPCCKVDRYDCIFFHQVIPLCYLYYHH